ncbi:unnamed protein product [Staurois parvus]|uniref:Uncharacterized protein n=1 Tax=Staurois parvus TaxID=386267 RepID=A0ABN9ET25_9NEOB|nr:unnamed protein product [Staurois parvus]
MCPRRPWGPAGGTRARSPATRSASRSSPQTTTRTLSSRTRRTPGRTGS